MDINKIQRAGAVNPYRNNQDVKSESIQNKKMKKDEVQISPEAKELLGAQKLAASSERNEKIEELKQSVASGTYNVDANKIAEKLLPFFK